MPGPTDTRPQLDDAFASPPTTQPPPGTDAATSNLKELSLSASSASDLNFTPKSFRDGASLVIARLEDRLKATGSDYRSEPVRRALTLMKEYASLQSELTGIENKASPRAAVIEKRLEVIEKRFSKSPNGRGGADYGEIFKEFTGHLQRLAKAILTSDAAKEDLSLPSSVRESRLKGVESDKDKILRRISTVGDPSHDIVDILSNSLGGEVSASRVGRGGYSLSSRHGGGRGGRHRVDPNDPQIQENWEGLYEKALPAIEALYNSGFKNESVKVFTRAVAIGGGESGYNPNDYLETSKEKSYGFMQINTQAHTWVSKSKLTDNNYCAYVAYNLYKADKPGQRDTFHPWTTDRNGRADMYQEFAEWAVKKFLESRSIAPSN